MQEKVSATDKHHNVNVKSSVDRSFNAGEVNLENQIRNLMESLNQNIDDIFTRSTKSQDAPDQTGAKLLR
jgi:hypothetical protein